MRISTNTMFEMGSGKIGDLTSALYKTQQQISTNRRILTPADDPVGAAAALGMRQALSVNAQYAINRKNAEGALSQEESVLQGVTLLLQDLKTAVVNAGNGALDNQQREFMATDLRSRFDELLSMANSRDGVGNYIFSGYQAGSQPFSKSATGAVYNGDQGERMLQVGSGRQMGLNDSGTTVFENNRTGNGDFTTGAAAANTGSGIIGTGSVSDVAQLTGRDYNIAFTVDATTGVTTYDVTDTTLPPLLPPPVLPTAVPYASGESITFGGMQFDIQGAPANGDSFTVKPSADQSIFTTMNDLINALSKPANGSTGQTQLTNALNVANNNIDNAMDNISAVRTSIGSRLAEIDALDSAGSDLDIQYTKTLSDLEEIDQVEAYSLFTQQQFTLEAAQKTFIQIAGMSLFNMM